MKRIIAALSVAALATGTLVGCSGDGNEESAGDGGQKSINLWMPTLANDNRDKEMWSEISADFEKENNVKVNITVVPWDAYETKFLTGVASGNGPDVGYLYPEMLGDYIAKDQLVALDDFVTAEQKDNLLYLPAGQFNDTQYGLPLLVGAARVLFYNKDLLDKAGVQPPTNWDDFKAGGEKLKAAGITPWIAPWGDKGRGIMNSNFFPFIWQNDGELFAKDGSKTLFDSPEVVESAAYLKDMMDAGVLDPSSTGANVESSRKSFQNGEVAYLFESEAKSSLWDDAGVNYGWVLSLDHKKKGTFIASDDLVMFKGCEDKDLCYKFMDYLTQGKQMSRFHKQAPYQPVGKDEKIDNPSEFSKLYEENPEVLNVQPILPNSAPTLTILYSEMQAMLTGKKSPEEALKDAADQGNKALEK
ncbi:ABC transporter substrate-binding protein [Corynebacterium mendelii]|uniref:Sugar ABC transporter substrate-binding protein n=1 Tax=Corynebacterium mendelii TaxID=2765362 RepID=A0A939DZA0_9CORY|nr:sugar ABC transporter substrate-binding protein [Corynebacterium mendelii]MBN9644004.1 sugar ABC transporter substrate-binding protein [Corynebacterium mendelii]